MVAYLQRRKDGQKQIGNTILAEKKTRSYPGRGRSGGGAPRRCACCWPYDLKKKEARVFGSLKKRKAKKALADEEATVPMGRFIAQGGEDGSVACTGMVFTLGSNRGTHG